MNNCLFTLQLLEVIDGGLMQPVYVVVEKIAMDSPAGETSSAFKIHLAALVPQDSRELTAQIVRWILSLTVWI